MHLAWLSVYGEDGMARQRSRVSERTVSRWGLKDENYIQAREILTKNKVEFVVELMKGLAVQATQTLESLLRSDDEKIQMSAVNAILNQVLKDRGPKQVTNNLNVIHEVTFQEVEALEKALRARTTDDSK